MTSKVYENFFECLSDLGDILGVSHLDEIDIGIKFMRDSNYLVVAEYLQEQANKLNWHIKKEFEDVNYA
jgi:hypothetical protein